MDAPAIGDVRDQKQAATPDVVRTSRADLVLKPAALVNHLSANNSPVELKSEDDLTASMLYGVTDELRNHQRYLAKSFGADLAREVAPSGSTSQTGGGRVRREVERKVDVHQIPMREKGRR